MAEYEQDRTDGAAKSADNAAEGDRQPSAPKASGVSAEAPAEGADDLPEPGSDSPA